MNALSYDLATVQVLWRRDLMRFFGEPTRVLGALGQPIILWLVLGFGLSPTFGLRDMAMPYTEFLFPGVVMMVLLFSSIFSTISVIEDRSEGFLQAVLAGPGSRSALVVGKCLGAASVAMLQAGAFLLLAPFAGFSFPDIAWPLLLSTMALTSLGLTGFGFLMAWWINSIQGYHAVQMTLLMPLWVMSGAVFPPHTESLTFVTLMELNPLSYAMSAMRHAFYGGQAPEFVTLAVAPELALGVVAGVSGICLVVAMLTCESRQ